MVGSKDPRSCMYLVIEMNMRTFQKAHIFTRVLRIPVEYMNVPDVLERYLTYEV